MARIRVSTTVDERLLKSVREIHAGTPDSTLLDQALTALLVQHRSAEVDARYVVYDAHPLDETDEWGDLASFHKAAAVS
jgi:hypothetical protein